MRSEKIINTILAFLFVSITLLGTSAEAKTAPTYSVTNMGQDFKTYITKYRNSSVDERWQGWKLFESKYQAYYDSSICDHSLSDCEAKKKSSLESFWTELPNFEPSMWKLFAQAKPLSKSQFKKFNEKFPDLPNNTEIVFMPALLKFNGQGIEVNKKPALVIGVDMVAKKDYNLDVLFSHEFFHIYQFAKIPRDKIYKTFYSRFWFEGFATQISSELNPGLSNSDYLMNADLGKYCDSEDNIKKMAKDFLPIAGLSVTDTKADAIYTEWFRASNEPGVHRKAYCLGFAALREILKSKVVVELVSLDEQGFRPLVDEALKQLTK